MIDGAIVAVLSEFPDLSDLDGTVWLGLRTGPHEQEQTSYRSPVRWTPEESVEVTRI